MLSCDKCGCPFKPVEPDGPLDAKFVIVGEAPGETENSLGEYFTGRSGKLLWRTLSTLGFERSQFYVTNALKCFIRTPTVTQIENCREHLVRELNSLQSKELIIALGASAMKALRVPTTKGIRAVTGKKFFLEEFNCRCLCVLHPAYILRNIRQFNLFKQSLGVISDMQIDNDVPEIRYIETLEKFKELLRKLKGKEIAIDLETSSLVPQFAKIYGCGIFDGEICYQVPAFDIDDSTTPLFNPETLSMLNECEIICHNGSYDAKILLCCAEGPMLNIAHDTMLQGYCLDEGANIEAAKAEGDVNEGGFSLERMACIHLGARPWKHMVDRTNVFGTDSATVDKYLALDCKYTYFLHRKLSSLMPKYYSDLLMPIYRAKTKMEHRGILVDTKVLGDEILNYKDKVNKSLEDIQKFLETLDNNPLDKLRITKYLKEVSFTLAKVKEKYPNGATPARKKQLLKKFSNLNRKLKAKYSPEGFKPSSPEQVLVVLEKLSRKKLESTDEEHLGKLLKKCNKDTQGFIEGLLEYRGLEKILETFLKGMERKLIKGRVHTHLNVHGTVSGRMTSKNPSLHTIPKDLRHIFIPDPGMIFLDADYNQLEYVMAAVLADDRELLKLMESGYDIHAITTAYRLNKVLGDYTKEERTASKPVSFRTLYDENNVVLASVLGLSIKETEEFREKYFSSFDRLRRKVYDEVMQKRSITTVFGRVRRFPIITRQDWDKIKREAFNTYIQSPSNDVCFSAAILIAQEFEEKNLGWLCLTFHDEILACVYQNVVDEAEAIMRKHMEMKFDFSPVPFRVKIERKERW